MVFADYVVIGVIVLLVGAAVAYIIREKRKGKKCIGCPYCSSCSSRNSKNGCCSGSGEQK